jgi:hypothetical protein
VTSVPARERLLRPVGLAPLVVLAAATALSVAPLVAHGALPFGSDTTFHALCVRGFVAALREGILYPRWMGDANVGFGAPTFIYYAPLGYYLVGLVSLATSDPVAALKWSMVLATVATAASFFVFTRDVATDTAAAAGAALYLLLPYRMVDLYERCAYGELLAFVWFPALFWAVRRLGSGFSWPAWFVFAIAYAALVTTHVLSAYMVLAVLAPYAVLVAWRSRRPAVIAHLATAGAAALMLSGVYLLPAVFGREETNVAYAVGTKFRWWGNFILRDATTLGFAYDDIRPWVDGASVSTAVLAAGVAWFGRERFASVAFAIVAAGAFLLETPLSTPVWSLAPGLAVVQFPWRFAAFGVFATASLAAVAFSTERRRLAAIVAGAAAIPALALSASVTHVHDYVFDRALSEEPDIARRMMYEYLPAGADWAGFWSSLDPVQPEAFIDGAGVAETLEWSSERRRLRVTTPDGAAVVLRTLAMRGWETRLDGRPAPLTADPVFHAIRVEVPRGARELEAVYVPTPERRAGAMLSAAGVLMLAFLGLVARRRARPRGRER